MWILIFALIHAVLMAVFGVFGMTLFPEKLRRTESRNTLFLVSPLLGVAAWLSLTIGCGMLIPYNVLYLASALFLAAIWVYFRRKTLLLPEHPVDLIWPVAFIFFSAIISHSVVPREIDGGLYFPPPVYDHVKCAIVHAISSHGLPPVNPWLADGGKPLALIYYFGWHAWTAQLPILTGCDAFFAECTMTGFTFAAVMTGLVGLTGFCRKGKKRFGVVFLILLVVFDIEYTDLVKSLVPESWMSFFSTRIISGFWNLYDDFIWSPQHMLAAAAVILILCFHGVLLRSENAKEAAPCAALIGFLAATALFTSVYSGVFSLVAVAALMAFDYLRDKDFRKAFNRVLFWQAGAVFLALALTALYVKFLFSHPSEICPVAFGMMPCFGEISRWWQYPLYFFQFYFAVLPMRLGLIYVFGMIAVFLPGILPKHPLLDFCKKYIVVSFLVIFFVHSTFYSNDFCWRFIAPPQLLLAVFSVFLLGRINLFLFRIVKKKRYVAVIAAVYVALFVHVSMADYWRYRDLQKYDAKQHRAFARAVPGWEVVRAHTDKNDLVLCNPAGFYEIGKVQGSTQSTNVFFSLYAQRCTPIGDLIFSKCYSEFFPQEKLEMRYAKVVALFAGNPSKSDADYLADDLKVRAVLVTPRDGLWENPGGIESRFPMKEETENFRVYWKEK